MTLFTRESTDGYTDAELDSLNTEWDATVEAEGLESHTDEYEERASQFCDEVSRRPLTYVSWSRKSPMTTRTYSTAGDVRGDCGYKHRTIAAARKCFEADYEGCKSQGGYSDRRQLVVYAGGEVVNATDAEIEEWHTGHCDAIR